MARPDPDLITISHGLESWDTAIEDKFGLVFDTPLPLARYANFAALPAASAYEDCLAVTEDTNDLYISDGSDWILVGVTTFLGLSDTPASFVGQEGKVLAVNAGANALEFVSPAAGGKGFTGKDFYTDFSTSETDTGLAWVDGRKIYQKVIAIAAFANGAVTPTLLQTAHGVAGIERFVDVWGYAKNAAGQTVPIPYIHSASAGYGISLAVSDTYINTRSYGADFSGYSGHVVIQYTKSVDDAASSDWPSYSESEQATGRKHINGKPIYRKTFIGVTGPDNDGSTVVHSISNMEDVVSLRGLIISAATVDGIAVPGYSDNNGVNRACWLYVTSTNIYWQTTTTDYSARTNSHITIEYTKSTDQGVDTSSYLGKDATFEEINTGNKWIDGLWIYKKVIRTGTGPNAVGIGHHLNIPNLGQVIQIRGTASNSTDHVGRFATPLFYTFGASKHIKYTVQESKLSMATQASQNVTQFTDELLIVYYTKTVTTPLAHVQTIRSSITLYVVASGGSTTGDGSLTAPFSTLAAAFAWLADKRIIPSATVTISVGAGTYTSTSTVELNHPDQNRIEITGYTTALTARTINAVNTGTKTFTINGVDCRSEFPAGGAAKIYGSTLNDGVFTVASNGYSGGNTTVVVNETVRDSTVDGSIKGYGIIDRILAFTDVAGLLITKDLKNLNGFLINGNGGGSAQVGVNVSGAAVVMGNNICIKGFSGTGLQITESGALTAGDIVSFSHAGICIVCTKSSTITLGQYAAGCRSSANQGLFAQYQGVIAAPSFIATENYATNVAAFDRGQITATGLVACYSTTEWGVYCAYGSGCRLGAAKCRYNAAAGIQAIEGAHVSAPAAVCTHNTTYGMVSSRMSSLYAGAASLTDNGSGASSPAVDTEGNNNSLIYS